MRTLFLVSAISASCNYAGGTNDACGGSDAFFNIIGRPGNMVSTCAMPFKKMDLESGYQYQQLYSPTGTQQNLPALEIRVGLPGHNEFFIFPPNHISQSISPGSGYSQTTTGFKHQFSSAGRWLTALYAALNLNDGSAGFGNQSLGVTINGIASCSLTSKFGLAMMLGGSSLTNPILTGGQRVTSINPDLLLSYSISPGINIFGEIFGQSKTGPGLGAGFDGDIGVLFLLRQNMIADLSIGQRLSGFQGNFEHFFGAGFSILL